MSTKEPPSYQPKSTTDSSCVCETPTNQSNFLEASPLLKELIEGLPMPDGTIAEAKPEVLAREVKRLSGLVLEPGAARAFAEIFNWICKYPPKDLYGTPVPKDCCTKNHTTALDEFGEMSEECAKAASTLLDGASNQPTPFDEEWKADPVLLSMSILIESMWAEKFEQALQEALTIYRCLVEGAKPEPELFYEMIVDVTGW